MAAHPAKTQPFSIRLGAQVDLLVADEVRRSGHSRSAVVEELAEEAAKTRLFPGIAFRDGNPRRAWAIGSRLDVWQIIEMIRSYRGNNDLLLASHPLVTDFHLHLARAYTERFPEEIEALIESNHRPLEEIVELYPFIRLPPSR
jgi:hypothetical protein